MRIENPITSTNKHGETIQSHPAFGLVKTSRVHTTGIRLFDSELKHHEYIEIGVYEAEMTMDREHPTPRRSTYKRRPIVEIRLSQAQWAAMVSSFGVGDGVPCTISYRSSGDAERLLILQNRRAFVTSSSLKLRQRHLKKLNGLWTKLLV